MGGLRGFSRKRRRQGRVIVKVGKYILLLWFRLTTYVVAAAAALSSTASFDAYPGQGGSDGDENGSRAIRGIMVRIALHGRILGRHVGNGFGGRASQRHRLGSGHVVVDRGRAAILQVRAALD